MVGVYYGLLAIVSACVYFVSEIKKNNKLICLSCYFVLGLIVLLFV